MYQAQIRNLFSGVLQSSQLGARLRTSYDNVPLKPEAAPNESHLQTHLIPAPAYSDTLGGDILTYTGIYQIKVLVGAGLSTADADTAATDLHGLFKVNTVFTNATGLRVQVTEPLTVGEGRRIDGWWVVPCHFPYRCDTN